MEIPTEFFTLSTISSFGGIVTTTYLITNTLYYLTESKNKWIAFFIAELLVIFFAFYTGAKGIDFFVAFINGILVYVTAIGASVVLDRKVGLIKSSKKYDDRGGNVNKHYFEKWF